MERKYKILLSNTAVFAVGNILIKFISFFLMPLYTSYLSASQYGTAELINNFVEIVMPIATICIVDALYRFSIDNNADNKSLFSNALLVVIIGNIIVGLVCVLINFFTKNNYFLFFFFLHATLCFFRLTTQFARGLGYSKRFAFYGVLNALCLVASNIVLLIHLNLGCYGYLLSFSIGYGLAGMIAFFSSRCYRYISFNSLNLKVLKEMLAYSVPGVPNMLSWWVNNLSSRYFIMFFCGNAPAGLFAASSKLPAIVNVMTSVFQQSWQYSTATEINRENSSEFFSQVFRVYAYGCSCICAIIILLNKIICSFILKAEFANAWRYVPLLLFSATLGCFATYFGTFYNAIKNNKMLMVSTLFGAMTNVVACLLLIPKFGCFGAAFASVATYVVILLFRIVDISKIVKISFNKLRFLSQLCFLCALSITASVESDSIFIISSLLCFLVFMTDFRLPFSIICKKKKNCVRN